MHYVKDTLSVSKYMSCPRWTDDVCTENPKPNFEFLQRKQLRIAGFEFAVIQPNSTAANLGTVDGQIRPVHCQPPFCSHSSKNYFVNRLHFRHLARNLYKTCETRNRDCHTETDLPQHIQPQHAVRGRRTGRDAGGSQLLVAPPDPSGQQGRPIGCCLRKVTTLRSEKQVRDSLQGRFIIGTAFPNDFSWFLKRMANVFLPKNWFDFEVKSQRVFCVSVMSPGCVISVDINLL